MAQDTINTPTTDDLINFEVSDPSDIPFLLYDKPYKRTTKLADITISSPMKGQNNWYSLSLKEPVFASTIIVEATGYEHKDCEFRWDSVSKGKTEAKDVGFSTGRFLIEINDFISRFEFKPERRWLADPQITSVRIVGYTMDAFEAERKSIPKISNLKALAIQDANAIIAKAENAKQRIAEAETTISKLNEQISELEASIASRNEKVSALKETEVKLSDKLSNLNAEMSIREARLEKQKEAIQSRTSERDQLVREVTERTAELNKLKSDIYLFPSELSKFADRSGKDKAFYWKLSAIPLIVLTLMASLLLLDAHNLAPVLEENESARVFSIFLTRLPYVIVATAIIGAMYKIAQILISEIIRIDKQTCNLAKLSIIATDVSNASEDGLELLDEEKFHLRTGLKMDLLREHLKTYISEDFSYLSSERVKERMKYLAWFRRGNSETTIEGESQTETPGA